MISTLSESELLRAALDDDANAFAQRSKPTAPGAAAFVGITVSGSPSDVQTVGLVNGPTGGSFTLSKNPTTSIVVPWNSTAAALQAQLVAGGLYGAGNAVCTGGPLPAIPITVTFVGALLHTVVPLMTGSPLGLTGPAPPPPLPRYEVRIIKKSIGEPAYPSVANACYLIQTALAGGSEVVGGVATIVAGGLYYHAFNLGAAIPPLGTFVLVRRVTQSFVFRY